jgi:hypothetical protein
MKIAEKKENGIPQRVTKENQQKKSSPKQHRLITLDQKQQMLITRLTIPMEYLQHWIELGIRKEGPQASY